MFDSWQLTETSFVFDQNPRCTASTSALTQRKIEGLRQHPGNDVKHRNRPAGTASYVRCRRLSAARAPKIKKNKKTNKLPSRFLPHLSVATSLSWGWARAEGSWKCRCEPSHHVLSVGVCSAQPPQPRQIHFLLKRAWLRVVSASAWKLKPVNSHWAWIACSPSRLLSVANSFSLIRVLWERVWPRAAQQPLCRKGCGSPGCIAGAHTQVGWAFVSHPASHQSNYCFQTCS